jgi:P27 family predicted phage terminase small subunit
MAITGPPPKPSKLRKLEGDASHRPRNKREPDPTGPLVRPDSLSDEAAAEWDRAVAAMPPGLYTSADAPVLAVYANAWVTYQDALEQVAAEGVTSVGSQGQPVAHPAVAILKGQAELILRASDRLGMSPSARTRMAMPEQPKASRFDGLIGARRDLQVVGG